MVNYKKTFLTKEISKKQLNSELILCGWIQKIRRLSSLCFLEFRNTFPILQVVVNKTQAQLFAEVQKINKETIVRLRGKLVLRKDPNINQELGQFELLLTKLEVLNSASESPFLIVDETDGLEKIRLKHRHLDLRRSTLQQKIRLRSQVIQNMRNFFHQEKFTEIETPLLSVAASEGAANFFVNFSSQPKKEFVLPQSPQIYKQILMASGFEKYFQIARCFRDEDSRQDRQPEFTQLDLEIAFANSEDVMQEVEKMLTNLQPLSKKFNFSSPFPRLQYSEVLARFGTDQPDLRYGLELADFSEFSDLSVDSDLVMLGFSAQRLISAQDFSFLQAELEKLNITDLQIFSHLRMMNLSLSTIEKLKNKFPDWKKKTIFLLTQSRADAQKNLGIVRVLMAQRWKLIDAKINKFCWVINGPLFTWSKTKKKYTFHHHPFTLPVNKKSLFDNWTKAKSAGYDLILNGQEIGSGSERIYEASMQRRIFEILGYSASKIAKEYEFLLKIMTEGFPPSAGIALGVDRLVMAITEANSIRDVIAFPKTLNFNCLLTNSPRKKR